MADRGLSEEKRDRVDETIAEAPGEPLPAPEAGPRAMKPTMPGPILSETGAPLQREFGRVARGVPEDVTGAVRRREPPWPGEEPVTPEKVELEPGGDPAMRARRYGPLGTDKDQVMGEQFAEDQ